MEENEAAAIVRSLLGRLTPQNGKYRLPEGLLSSDDVKALSQLAGLPPVDQDTVAETAPIELDTTAVTTKGPTEPELRICIDFGTAMSKAWACRGDDDETIPLILGRSAGSGDTLAVPSSIFISQSGRLFLGAAAETQHRQEIETGRQRFDNLKRMLSEAEVGQELDDVPLPREIDPTNSGLTKGDLLVLYLAWVTDLALDSLFADEKDNGDLRYVRRRFAIPCFEFAQDETVGGTQRAVWAREVLKRALLRAQVVADTLRGKWADLSTNEVAVVMVEVRKLDTTQLEHLLAETCAVREPVAAAASRFDEEIVRDAIDSDELVRRLLLVIDAGAGTTDFALFQVFSDPSSDRTKYGLIKQAVLMFRIAGNAVDEILRPIVLRQCLIDPHSGYPRSTDDFNLIKIDLSAQIRAIKRDLFAKREASIQLRPDVSGMLSLETVLDNSDYKRLGTELKNARDGMLKTTFESNEAFLKDAASKTMRSGRSFPIHVLLTGGSSALPIVRALADGELSFGDARFGFISVNDLPTWINSLPREEAELVSGSYQQCAVAIGGSAKDLPIELKDLQSPITPPAAGPRIIERYQVTGVG